MTASRIRLPKLVLPDTDHSSGQQVAEALLGAVRNLTIPHEGTEPGILTISLGVATLIPSAKAGPADLLAQADAKLYEAKKGGRNRVEGSRSPQFA